MSGCGETYSDGIDKKEREKDTYRGGREDLAVESTKCALEVYMVCVSGFHVSSALSGPSGFFI